MGRRSAKALDWLKRAISITGFLVFIAGLHWLWLLRYLWPRAASDPVQEPILEAIGVIIGGMYLVLKGQ